ncbi:MAG: molybdate ABC transporter substrate-binding protein [Comamonadaceae bacterium]|nr:molybdate ABC transporter substrate-binding protein [Comamonadaceae bacterium]
MFRRVFLCCATWALAVPAMAGDGLLIAAGAGYRKPVLELVQAFTEATGIKAEASFGNMKQIEMQARQNPDISVLIGDKAFLAPMQLSEKFDLLGQGKLVLVAAQGQSLQGLEDLKGAAFQRIAMPDRSKAVYGNAAYTCLERSGLMPAVQARLLEVATVPQVSAYVLTRQVDAGFVNATEALALQDKAGPQVAVAATCYDPIELSMTVLTGRENSTGVQAFQDFVATPTARKVMQRHGM